jgi:uncharacterized membrane protein YtjA (UPF0391 family)
MSHSAPGGTCGTVSVQTLIDKHSLTRGGHHSLYYALIFLILGLDAGALGVSGVAAMATQIAYVLFVIAVVCSSCTCCHDVASCREWAPHPSREQESTVRMMKSVGCFVSALSWWRRAPWASRTLWALEPPRSV